jgi:hypothetical protein
MTSLAVDFYSWACLVIRLQSHTSESPSHGPYPEVAELRNLALLPLGSISVIRLPLYSHQYISALSLESRLTSLLSFLNNNMSAWDKTKHGSKAAFDKAWAGFEKLGVPVNKLTNKIGSEAFWPTTLDHESDKAARILKSFCSEYSRPFPDPSIN